MNSKYLTYSYWFKKVLYPTYNHIIDRKLFRSLEENEEIQWLPREKIREYQFRQLHDVLQSAYKYVPFYQRKFQEIKLHPDDIKSIEDFHDVPVLVNKEDLRENTNDFIATNCNPKKLNWHRTGGSTGEPLIFPTDHISGAASASDLYRAFRWWDIDFGARSVYFWGSPRFIILSFKDRLKKYTLAIRHKLMNRKFFSNYDLNPENMLKYYRIIQEFKPELVRGMPSSLYIFSKFLLENELNLKQIGIKAAFSTCEYLYDWEREIIEEAFGCKVVNGYGLSEFGEIAFEYKCGNVHLMDENVLIELAAHDNNIDEGGEIVVTHLKNRSTPLIKYKTGDIATSIEDYCGCGLGLRVLNGLKGRAHDFIVKPDGGYIHGQFFTHLFVFMKGIKKYQVIQEQKDKFLVKLVTEDTYDLGQEDTIKKTICKYLGSQVDITIDYVADIPVEASGKFRWIVSKVGKRDIH